MKAAIDKPSIENALMAMFGNQTNLIYVTTGINIAILVRVFGREYFKIAPQNADANFYMDLISIAFTKASILRNEFSKL